ncbi:MAG: hypothetical protein HQ549_00390 [Candidatus Omnitrophica bacterium]|nr:hypothetical protein [Candidatus Omnitrophota bacterium]
MKDGIKKIIKKEGLILLGIVVISAIVIFALRMTEFAIVGEQAGQQIVTFAFMFMLLGYPVYLLIRLILWAIRGSKGK